MRKFLMACSAADIEDGGEGGRPRESTLEWTAVNGGWEDAGVLSSEEAGATSRADELRAADISTVSRYGRVASSQPH